MPPLAIAPHGLGSAVSRQNDEVDGHDSDHDDRHCKDYEPPGSRAEIHMFLPGLKYFVELQARGPGEPRGNCRSQGD